MEKSPGNVEEIIKMSNRLELLRDLFPFELSRSISLNKLDMIE
jgi:hypothetical protein